MSGRSATAPAETPQRRKPHKVELAMSPPAAETSRRPAALLLMPVDGVNATIRDISRK